MFDDENMFVSMDHLAARLSLPQRYLKQLAADRKIPFLLVGNRMKFNPIAVQEVLGQLASINSEGDESRGQSDE